LRPGWATGSSTRAWATSPERRLYLLGQPDPLIAAEQLLTHRVNVDLILEQWDELLRIAGSIKRGWIVPSVLISRMATDPKPDRTARALREYGRLIETNFILRWAVDPPLRQRSHAQLNKGENANALRRALGYGNRRRVRVRARDPEQLHRQLEARRLGANAIHYWNTRTSRSASRTSNDSGSSCPTAPISGVHNAHHEHINLIGHHAINLRAVPSSRRRDRSARGLPPITASTGQRPDGAGRLRQSPRTRWPETDNLRT